MLTPRAFLIAFLLGVVVHAQAPAPLTADQLRAQIATLEQQIVVLQAQLRLTTAPAAPPTAGPQTLAAASAAAVAVTHAWPASTNTLTTAPVVIGGVPPPAAADAPASPARGETYWRARVAPLRQKIRANLAKAGPLNNRIADLMIELNGIGPQNARRGGVETERQRLITEAEALDAIMVADTQALAAIEEEGRRASALPGWFR